MPKAKPALTKKEGDSQPMIQPSLEKPKFIQIVKKP
jgi:hypothetical protein